MLKWGKIDKRLLDEKFVQDLEELFAKDPNDWLVTYGYRSLAEQAALHKKYLAGGPKAAPAGKSAHNFGLAIDLVLDGDTSKPGIQPSWDTRRKAWTELFMKLEKHPRLKSGVSFGDGGHIERYQWQRYVPK